MLFAVVGCSSEDPPSAILSRPSPASTATTTLPLAEFERSTLPIGGVVLEVALAGTPELHAQGLMGVTDLGGLDGMLFVFDKEADLTFWMFNTLIPLDIVFFDSQGGFVSSTRMEPCPAKPCPTYPSGAPARYALEMPAGGAARLGDRPQLEIG